MIIMPYVLRYKQISSRPARWSTFYIQISEKFAPGEEIFQFRRDFDFFYSDTDYFAKAFDEKIVKDGGDKICFYKYNPTNNIATVESCILWIRLLRNSFSSFLQLLNDSSYEIYKWPSFSPLIADFILSYSQSILLQPTYNLDTIMEIRNTFISLWRKHYFPILKRAYPQKNKFEISDYIKLIIKNYKK